MKKGKVYLVGAGPGKTDLITVRGLNILKEADTVIYDYLVARELLEYAKPDAELICCDKLAKKGRYSDGFLIHQEKIHELIVRKAKEGKKVIRLKNGDPSIFSRSSQELEVLVKNNIEFEVVPGIAAGVAAAGLNGIPLTDRRYASSCVFVTGHEDPKKKESLHDWNALSRMGTLVLYMAVENLETVVSRLLEAGKDEDTPVAIIQNASLITQKILTGTLKNIVKLAEAKKIKPPAVAIIGEVVRLEKEFNWLKKNKRILFTGLSQERFFMRGSFFHLPLIKIEPLDDYKEFDESLKNLNRFDWIVFTSRYGVDYFFARLKTALLDTRAIGGIKIAAIGNSTKNRLLDMGIRADLVPKEESSRGLLKRFRTEPLKGKSIFLPRSDISDKGLEEGLRALGARVSTGFAYRNVMPKDLPDLDLNNFDEIMFTSPSTARNFKKRYKKIPRHIRVRCIGEVTLKEAKRCKLVG